MGGVSSRDRPTTPHRSLYLPAPKPTEKTTFGLGRLPTKSPVAAMTINEGELQEARSKEDTEALKREEYLATLSSGYVRIHGGEYFHEQLNIWNTFFETLTWHYRTSFTGLKLSGNDDGHSSPLFVINLYKDNDSIERTHEQGGEVSAGRQKTEPNPIHRIKRTDQYMTCTEELRIIPVEDIVAINYSCQFRKSIHHEERVDTAQEVKYTGNFFKKKQTRDVEHVTDRNRQDAKRLITVKIEYFK
jgi:hypothetical protein